MSEGLFSRASSRADFDVLFERALAFRDSHGMWAVARREDEAIVGRVGFFAFGEQQRPELVFLLSQSAWGQGLATEACGCAIRFTLEEKPWSEMVAVVRSSNRAAQRVLEKLGFSFERSFTLNGEPAHLWHASRGRLQACRITSGCS